MTTYYVNNVPMTSYKQYTAASSPQGKFSGQSHCSPVFLNDDAVLNEIIEQHYQNTRLGSEKTKAVDNFIACFQYNLDHNQEFGPHTELEVFGSLTNGLASNIADVDISLRWPHSDHLQKWEKVCVLQKILPILHDLGCYDVVTVFQAKIPIVKCHYFEVETGQELDVDVSINNELALKNTALIRQYVQWEPKRLPRLAAYVKQWAKFHDIGSAASGTLSSYAHTTMLLHFLQNVSPAVLPRLQEDFRSASEKEELVEDSDVYFSKLVMPRWSRNRMTAAELFRGFLKFYAEFDFDKKVVQIRTRRIVLKSVKNWYSAISIEDPFILDYNLGQHARESSRIVSVIRHSSLVYSSNFGIYRKQLQYNCGFQHITGREEYISALEELLASKVNDLMESSTQATQSHTSCQTPRRKRLAASPVSSPRFEKQPLWFPPAQHPQQQLPSESVQYNPQYFSYHNFSPIYQSSWY